MGLPVLDETEKAIYKEERVLNKKKNEYYREIATLKTHSEQFDHLLANVEQMRAFLARMGAFIRQGEQGTRDPL